MFFKIGVLCWSLFDKVAGLQAFRPATLLKRDSSTRVFLWNLRLFKDTYLHKTPSVAVSNISNINPCFQRFLAEGFRQKQPPEVFFKKRCSEKFQKVHRKTPVPESAAILKNRDSGIGVFLWILWNFSERLFYRTPLDDCFRSENVSISLLQILPVSSAYYGIEISQEQMKKDTFD